MNVYGYGHKRSIHVLERLHTVIERLTYHEGYADSTSRWEACQLLLESLIHNELNQQSLTISMSKCLPQYVVVLDGRSDVERFCKEVRELFTYPGTELFASVKLEQLVEQQGLTHIIDVSSRYNSARILVISSTDLWQIDDMYRMLSTNAMFCVSLVDNSLYPWIERYENRQVPCYYIKVKNES